MSAYASISIDRRASYYERAAALIAANPLGFYARAERGRRIQAAIKPKDLQPFNVAPKPCCPVIPLSSVRGKRRVQA